MDARAVSVKRAKKTKKENELLVNSLCDAVRGREDVAVVDERAAAEGTAAIQKG